jgi:P-type Cu+ transporter
MPNNNILALEPPPLSTATENRCYHCHDALPEVAALTYDDKNFCCTGCQTVYQILNENDLCNFYNMDAAAGLSQKKQRDTRLFDYLNDPSVAAQLIDFQDDKTTKITFLLPTMHCASCIWLLENLYKINAAIFISKVNFLKKEAYVHFDHRQTTLRDVAVLLAQLGYPPEINLHDLENKSAHSTPSVSKRIYYQLGVAGFAFGNIMLLSFPEYLGLAESLDKSFAPIFGYLNLILAIPVLVFSAKDYLVSAYLGLKNRYLNLDVPLAIGIVALFGRSAYEILTQTGAGYMDSFASLIFLLLTGKWFQQKTFYHLSFERDYKSYFPISATLKTAEGDTSVALNKLEVGDIIFVKNGEIIPADGILMKGLAQIDYSFVTGEADLVAKKSGDRIYAGGRQMGETLEICLTKRVNQSYLTQLWNNEAFKQKHKSHAAQLADKAGRYFTAVILGVATLGFLYWLPTDIGRAVNAATAVLMIACPCAVALSIPFTLGNLLRIFGRKQFYLKNTNVMEAFETANIVVFDKTGTVTENGNARVEFVGLAPNVSDALKVSDTYPPTENLTNDEKTLVLSLAKQSNHPLSNALARHLSGSKILEVQDFEEIIGQGIQGFVGGKFIRLGSQKFIAAHSKLETQNSKLPNTEGGSFAQIFVQINGQTKGVFQIKPNYRDGFADILTYFKNTNRPVFLLSGDNDRERPFLKKWLPNENLIFNQTPLDKLYFIKKQQENGQKVLMIGDGLNDAGALQQADIGVVISENTNNFSPACDAILQADQFKNLPKFIDLAAAGTKIVDRAYLLAFCYNVVGLSYAVSGNLQPVIAAILMPLSSVTIVLFGVLSGNWRAKSLKY